MTDRPRKVREIMTTEVVTIGMDETLETARGIFNQRRFHHLIVMEGGKAVGVISDRDLLKNLSPFVGVRMSERPQDIGTLRKRIHQIMTRRLVSIEPDAPAAQAARTMMHHRVSCLPVIENGTSLVGIITLRDLVRWVVIDSIEE
ncbi:MAG: CBS domain-containing protein [Phycisphaerae bacterium]|jgi:acetoin utilization protein AcuB|nr:CBS domain-containing protein [Phycisphaerae bacterium]